jgi:hypothetical protein
MTTTHETYRHYLYLYGVLTLLYALSWFESMEDYEECMKIRDAILSHNSEFQGNLPLRNSKEAIQYVVKSYQQMGSNAFQAEERHQAYALSMIAEINDKYQ